MSVSTASGRCSGHGAVQRLGVGHRLDQVDLVGLGQQARPRPRARGSCRRRRRPARSWAHCRAWSPGRGARHARPMSLEDVLWSFAWITAVAAIAPLLVGLLPGPRIPEVVLLLALGIVIGPYGVELAASSAPIELLSQLGLGDAVPDGRARDRAGDPPQPRRLPGRHRVAGLPHRGPGLGRPALAGPRLRGLARARDRDDLHGARHPAADPARHRPPRAADGQPGACPTARSASSARSSP